MIKDIMRTVIVLSIIALISGGLLGIVDSFTQIDENEMLARKIASTGIYTGEDDLIKLSLSDGGISQGYPDGELRNVFKGGEQYIIHAAGMGGYGGAVELLINIENNTIKKIVKYSAEETPGLGTKAFENSYLTQFYNKDLAEVEAFVRVTTPPADANEIDAVSGATKSSGAVINAVNVAVVWYRSNAESYDASDEIIGSGNAQAPLSVTLRANGSGNPTNIYLNTANDSSNPTNIYLNADVYAVTQYVSYFGEVIR